MVNNLFFLKSLPKGLAPFRGLATIDAMTSVELLHQRIARLEADQQQLQEEILQANADRARANADRARANAERDRLTEENAELREKLAQQELEYQLLVQRAFGPKSERYIDDPNQLKLDFGDSDQIDDAIDGIKQAKEELEVEDPVEVELLEDDELELEEDTLQPL